MYRMLIVDDEERIVNSLYCLMEENFDLEIHRAYSAVTAVALMRKMRFDLVLSDISMPQMNGLELLEELRRLWPKCYVLLLTAYDRFDYAYKAIKYDRVDYLLKIESYDEICRVVRGKLELLAQEQLEDEMLLGLKDDLSLISMNVQRYILKRTVLQGAPMPAQAELDDIHLPIDLNQPALLMLGSLSVASPTALNRVIASISDYLVKHLSDVGIKCFSCASASYAFWIMQPIENPPLSPYEQIVYIHQLLDDIPELIEKRLGCKLALLCADEFIPWHELHPFYQRASVHLEQLHNESGMMIGSVKEELAQKNLCSSFPSIDEVNMLWEMLKCGNTTGLIALLTEGLHDLAQVPQLQAVLPNASVSAMAFFVTQAAGLYSSDQAMHSSLRKLMNCEGYETGAQWVADMIRMIEDILNNRDASQRSMSIWLVERINQYIEQHYAEDITLAALADEVHYSPSYLSRFYKTHTGQNLMAHISGVRIAHAKALLAKTNLKISEIAAQCGFCSTKYFNQVFKRTMDISAVQYREQHM